MKNITAVILAAGLGTRMKSEVPKVLHRLGSMSILGRTIHTLKEAGVVDIIVIIGHKADMVEEIFNNDGIRFVRQPKLLGSGDAVAQAVGYLDKEKGSILVTYGDTPLILSETYWRLVQAHDKSKASCTLLTCHLPDTPPYGRIVRNNDGKILKIVEEKDATYEEKKITEVNVGTYCFRNAHLKEYIRDIEINKKKKEFYLTDIADILVQNKKKVISEHCDSEEAIGINTRGDLAVANKIINRRTLQKLMDSGVAVVDPDTTFIDERAKIGKDTTILPSTVIGKDVNIASWCKIGPFARIRPGTKLAPGVEIGNYVEICRTEIGEKSKVKHHTYLGDTTIGCNVNIGAGTITANYDGKEKHKTVIEDDAFIGVGAMLIAPVKIGKGATVGAGSVVTKNKNVPAGQTVVGIPAKPLKAKKEKK